jgi:hypothetical protein
MKTKHTKGNWNGGKPNKDVFYVLSDNEKHICMLPANEENAEANAKLIAAAPEMLEALKYVIQWHREHDSGEGELFGLDFVTTAIQAVSKAEGE